MDIFILQLQQKVAKNLASLHQFIATIDILIRIDLDSLFLGFGMGVEPGPPGSQSRWSTIELLLNPGQYWYFSDLWEKLYCNCNTILLKAIVTATKDLHFNWSTYDSHRLYRKCISTQKCWPDSRYSGGQLRVQLESQELGPGRNWDAPSDLDERNSA